MEMEEEHISLVAHQSPVSAIRFTPDSRFMLTAGLDNQVRVWSVEDDFDEVALIEAHDKPIHDLAISPDGLEFATASADKDVRRFSLTDYTQIGEVFHGHKAALTVVQYSPSGRLLASASQDTQIRIWSRETGECLHTLKGHTRSVHSLIWLDDETRLASSGLGEDIFLWNLSDGTHVVLPTGHKASVLLGGLTREGDRLLSAGYEGQIRIWSTSTWEPRVAFEPGVAGHLSLAQSPFGGMLAIGSERSVGIWSLVTLEELIDLPIKPKGVHAVVFSPDNEWLVAASSDKRIRIWDVDAII